MALTSGDIVDAALSLLDEVGLDDLSTRRVAVRLGVQVGALYWHVANKHELLVAVTDKIIAEALTTPAEGEWSAQARDLATALRRALLRHRDGATLAAGIHAVGPRAMQFTDRLLGVFRTAGADPALAASAAYALLGYVVGITQKEQSLSRLAVLERRPAVDDGPFDPARYPHFAESLRHGSNPDQQFDTGLGMFLRGLAAEMAVHPVGA